MMKQREINTLIKKLEELSLFSPLMNKAQKKIVPNFFLYFYVIIFYGF